MKTIFLNHFPTKHFTRITHRAPMFLICFICIQASTVWAIQQMVTGAKAMALAGAVTASPPDLMAVHFNPAGLSQAREGLVYQQGLTAVSFNRHHRFSPDPSFDILNVSHAEDDPVANRSSAHGKSYLYYPIYGDTHGTSVAMPLPLGVSYRQSNSKWVMASGSYMPFAWGTCYDKNDPSQYQAYAYYQQHLVYASPGIAYQWSDTFSLGVSMGMGQTALGQSSIVRFPNEIMARSKSLPIPGDAGPFDGLANLQMNLRDDMAFSFNVGALWKPFSVLQLGCVYRSPVITRPKGTFHVQYTDELLMLTRWYRENPGYANSLNAPGLGDIDQPTETGSAYLEKYQWPDSIQMGLQYQALPHFRMMLDLQWTRWSSQKDYRLVFEKSDSQLICLLHSLGQTSVEGQTVVYEKSARDTLSYHFGMEWQIKESLLLRGGLSYQPQAAKDSHMSLLSIPDVTVISTGIEWRWPNRWVIEQSLGYFVSKDKTIKNNSSQQLNLTDLNNVFFSPYAGQHVSTKVSGFVFSMNVRIPLSQMKYWP
ncbi:MAG: outer membrane protein transport protein [Candidatus Magnetomorum sp.]|nr:outer membrane protein transport protein [Candidatus Magnetomorum sp.]